MIFRDGSRTAATSKMERSILDVPEVLNPPLVLCHCSSFFIRILLHHTERKGQSLEVFHKNGILKKLAKYAQRNTCVGVFINKFIGWRPATLLKRNYNTDVFLWILKNFKNTFLTKYHRVTSSETHHRLDKILFVWTRNVS